jgi:hypothetical protein
MHMTLHTWLKTRSIAHRTNRSVPVMAGSVGVCVPIARLLPAGMLDLQRARRRAALHVSRDGGSGILVQIGQIWRLMQSQLSR